MSDILEAWMGDFEMLPALGRPQENPWKKWEGFLYIPKKIWVITYNSPLKLGGGVFFRAVLGGKRISMFNGATVVALSKVSGGSSCNNLEVGQVVTNYNG